jgi:hypothetical protein
MQLFNHFNYIHLFYPFLIRIIIRCFFHLFFQIYSQNLILLVIGFCIFSHFHFFSFERKNFQILNKFWIKNQNYVCIFNYYPSIFSFLMINFIFKFKECLTCIVKLISNLVNFAFNNHIFWFPVDYFIYYKLIYFPCK